MNMACATHSNRGFLEDSAIPGLAPVDVAMATVSQDLCHIENISGRAESGPEGDKESSITVNKMSKGNISETHQFVEVEICAESAVEEIQGQHAKESESDAEEEVSGILAFLTTVGDSVSSFCSSCMPLVARVVRYLAVLGYFAYFGYAMYNERLEHEKSIRLCWVTCLVVFCLVIHYMKKKFGKEIKFMLRPYALMISKHSNKIYIALVCVVLIGIITFTLLDIFVISKSPYNLVSAAGLIFYLVVCFLASHNPSKVRWRPVVWGLILQFLLALLILRWKSGYLAFSWLGHKVMTFMSNVKAGARFVFGEDFEEHYFVFAIMPNICYFSTIVSVLYYLGVMQVVIHQVAGVMKAALGTTAGESVNAAANIFLSMTDSVMVIRPLVASLSKSELHSIMTAGFATVAGGAIATYIMMGVPANHLISACVMSAPASLAVSKLFYPETQKSKSTADVIHLPKSTSNNILAAISEGAGSSIAIIAGCLVNIIAFISVFQFINSTLTWFGDRVGIEELTLPFIFSYLMFPFALCMGVSIPDCRKVGMLIGTKIFLNEFIAYEELGQIIRNKQLWHDHVTQNGSWGWHGDDIILLGSDNNGMNDTLLRYGFLTDRSETIVTYALCSFANLGSMGIMLGCLNAIVPERMSTVSGMIVRAMIAANMADFITACIAGIYYQG